MDQVMIASAAAAADRQPISARMVDGTTETGKSWTRAELANRRFVQLDLGLGC